MALSPSAPASPLRRQLLRYVSSGLVAALHRPAPIISLPIAPRGVDSSASQRLQTTSRAAPSPKGRPGAPRQGSGGHVHAAAPAMATIARMATPMRRPTPPGPPAQGSGGKTNAVTTAATAHMAAVEKFMPCHRRRRRVCFCEGLLRQVALRKAATEKFMLCRRQRRRVCLCEGPPSLVPRQKALVGVVESSMQLLLDS